MRYLVLCSIALLAACSERNGSATRESLSPPAAVDEQRYATADSEPHNWFATNRGPSEDHFSPLSQINESNIDSLGFAWEYDTKTRRGLEASPIVVDGVMYTSGTWGVVYAIDAATGDQIWRYDPEVPGAWARRPCCDIVNRGVAVWQGRVYVGSLDGRLIALDAVDGSEVWEVDTLIDRSRYQTSTGAPKIAGDKVIIGNAGAELGVRGYITAYDVETGELAWRFYIVPGSPDKPYEHPELEFAAKTWDPNSAWDIGGGGTVWDAMAYDAELNLLYVGTGNGSPHPVYSRSPEGGDNLFLASILAINPDTGKLVWHYQTTPGESWDYTATSQMVLTDLEIDGEPRKVLLQAPKNGFFYVLDRATGQLLSAEKYAHVNWASHIDMETGRPVFTPQADYSEEPKLIYPGQAGAHNWRPMSFNPENGLVYIPVIEWPMVFSYAPKGYVPGAWNDNNPILPDLGEGSDSDVRQRGEARMPILNLDYLVAYDPLKQEEKWRIATSAEPEQSGGVLSTAGNLVFQGDASGFLHVYSADSGAALAHINVGTGIMAAPISYSIDGQQYVAVMAGVGGAAAWVYSKGSAAYRYGNAGRVVAFKLGGGDVPLPPRVNRNQPIPEPPEVPASWETIEHGEALFHEVRCSGCHGIGSGPGIVPDLAMMTPEKHDLFDEIVLDGMLEPLGMAGFSDTLSPEDVHAIHAYVVSESRKVWQDRGESEGNDREEPVQRK